MKNFLLQILQYEQFSLLSLLTPVVALKPVTPTMFLQIHHNDAEEGLLLLLYHFLLN
jgi:hypothetical protein